MIMALLTSSEAQIHYNIIHREQKLLGFLPVLDDAWWYYSWNNVIINEYDHITPVVLEYNETFLSDTDEFYINPLYPKERRDIKELHETNSKHFIDKFETCKYILFFVGSDDGSFAMRFKDEQSAIDFANSLDFLDEIIDHPDLLRF